MSALADQGLPATRPAPEAKTLEAVPDALRSVDPLDPLCLSAPIFGETNAQRAARLAPPDPLRMRLEHVAQAIARNTDRWASLLGEDMPFVFAQREHVAELQAVARLMVKP